jgi:BirA family transcriptional regulator, biotin operon repressor / biotin---[acetyl-CoA-carboxylase] ligase
MGKPLDREALHRGLTFPGSPWASVAVHPEIDSTNAEAARLGTVWTVVVADHQTAGRGRRGRTWTDRAGTAVAVSALVPAPGANLGWLPLLAGLAMTEAISEVAGVDARLKWPNDVLAPGDGWRKLCGVLCEAGPVGVVVGAGVNVSQDRTELSVDTATSLRLCGAGEVSREALVTAYLVRLAALHGALTGPYADLLAAQDDYRAACATIGQEVELHDGPADAPARVRRVVATGVDGQGRLTVRLPDGDTGPIEAVAAGDVVHVRSLDGADPPAGRRAPRA